MADNDILDSKETTKFLHMPSSTLRNYVANKKIPHLKIGKRVLFYRSDLVAFMDSCYVRAVNNERMQSVDTHMEV